MADCMESNGTGIGKFPSLVLGTAKRFAIAFTVYLQEPENLHDCSDRWSGHFLFLFFKATSATRDASPLAIRSSRCAGCETDCASAVRWWNMLLIHISTLQTAVPVRQQLLDDLLPLAMRQQLHEIASWPRSPHPADLAWGQFGDESIHSRVLVPSLEHQQV